MHSGPGSGPAAIDDVMVVGAGAIGCAAALGLAQSGLRVSLCGPLTPPAVEPWDARIYALSPASQRLLEQLRVWPALQQERIARIRRMRVFPAARPDAPELGFDAADAGTEALARILEHRNLAQALNTALSFSGVRLFPQAVVAAQTDARQATVELADGSRLAARLLVIADGADSPTRGALGFQADQQPYPQAAVVANFAISQPHQDCAWQWFGDHGVLALLPLPGDRCSIVWSAPQALAGALAALSPDLLAQRVTQASGAVFGALAPLGETRSFPLRLVSTERFITQRALLAGDAAHAVHPLAGQGMNLGFGDVAELIAVLTAREPFRDLGDPLLLRRYERARREPVLAMRLATDGLQRLLCGEPRQPLPRWMSPLQDWREVGWRAVAGSPWLRRRLIRHAVS